MLQWIYEFHISIFIMKNLVIHDIVPGTENKARKSDLTWEEVLSALRPYEHEEICLYVDDGYASILNYLPQIIQLLPQAEIRLAVITNFIDTPGYLSTQDLKRLDRKPRVTIVSHSTSHAALTPDQAPDDYQIPSGGAYQDHAYSKTDALSEQEILYQLKESQQLLETILDHPVQEFVLPFGWYTPQLISYIYSTKLYQTISVTGVEADTDTISYRTIILA